MKIDIVIATYNSEDRIGRTLESLSRSTLPKDQWRLLVMNNNSRDNTKAVVESFADKINVQVIDVPMPGKSKALNAALAHLMQDLILFTDDDVDLDERWMESMIAAAHNNASYDIFTGRIIGKWEKEPDAKLKTWIPVGSTYAIHERETSGDCDPGMVWGPNMAYRKRIFDEGFRFNEKIGPTPAAFYAMGEDTELAQRAFEAGHKVYYTADAVVVHTIKHATVNEDWVIRRAERLGYGRFVISPGNPHKRILPDALPFQYEIVLRLFFWACFYPVTFIMPRSKHRFWSRWKFYYFRGLYKSYRDYAQK